MKLARPTRLAIAVAVALVTPVSAGLAVAGNATENSQTRSADLANETGLTFAAPDTRWNGPQLIARAAALEQSVPLPTGGNFNGIRWADLPDASDQDIQFVLQINAACQWLRAVAASGESARFAAIAGEVPQWPALRDQEIGGAFRSALAQAATGDQQPSTALQQCRDAQVRQVTYAAQMGLQPPA